MAKATADDRARLRLWWFRKQGLIPSTSPRTVEACIKQTGWMTTAGSTGVYLSVRARMPGVSREAIDRAAIDGAPLIDIPGGHARPWTLVPRDEMALALRLHRASVQKHFESYFERTALNATGLRAVGAAICRALEEGPLSSTDMRKVVTHSGAREWWTGALIDLTLRGVVRRFPAGGRIDSPKYMYELLHPDDRPDLDAEGDEATVVAKGVERFLRWNGPATIDDISSWGSLTKSAVKKALGALAAESVSVAGLPREAWLVADDLAAWKAFKDSRDGSVVLLPYRDPFVEARSTPSVLARGADVPVLAGKPNPVRLASVTGLNHHTIVSGGELVGVWDYDPGAEKIVKRLWVGDKTLRRRVDAAAAETERFIRQQLGDAKLGSVDPPAKRAARLAFCRAR